jgi:hypothetical protein
MKMQSSLTCLVVSYLVSDRTGIEQVLDVYSPVRLSALMDLYINPLYVLVSTVLSSILNSPASIHPSTLSTVGHTCYFI